MKKKTRGRKKLSYTVPMYLIDVSRQTYDEMSARAIALKLNKCETFIKNRAKDHEIVIINGRGYFICDDLGDVWTLLD